MEIEEISEIKRLGLAPGDYLLAKSKRHLSQADIIRIQKRLKHIFAKEIKEKGIEILILDKDFDLEKIRITEIEKGE